MRNFPSCSSAAQRAPASSPSASLRARLRRTISALSRYVASLGLFQSSNRAGGGKLHIKSHWALPRQVSGGGRRRGRGCGSLVAVPGIPVFSVQTPYRAITSSLFELRRTSPILRNTTEPPRPVPPTLQALISDAEDHLRFTARSLVPPPSLSELRRTKSSTTSRAVPHPATQPPKGELSPGHQRAGCPRARAFARANQHAAGQSDAGTEALLQSPRLPSQILSEIQAAKPQRNQSHARRADATGTRSCAALPGLLWRLKEKTL